MGTHEYIIEQTKQYIKKQELLVQMVESAKKIVIPNMLSKQKIEFRSAYTKVVESLEMDIEVTKEQLKSYVAKHD